MAISMNKSEFFAIMRSAIKETNGSLSPEDLAAIHTFEMLFPNNKIDRLYASTKKDNEKVFSSLAVEDDMIRYAFIMKDTQILRCVECTRVGFKWTVNKKVWGWNGSKTTKVADIFEEAVIEVDVLNPNNYDAADDYYRAIGNIHIDGNELTVFNQELEDAICTPRVSKAHPFQPTATTFAGQTVFLAPEESTTIGTPEMFNIHMDYDLRLGKFFAVTNINGTTTYSGGNTFSNAIENMIYQITCVHGEVFECYTLSASSLAIKHMYRGEALPL